LNFERSQYWILTETDLNVVTKHYDLCWYCIPGCNQVGDDVKSIPLDSLSHCKTNEKPNGCMDWCTEPPPTLLATSEDGQSVVGYGLAHQDWFIREILNRRDVIKGRRSPNHQVPTHRSIPKYELPTGRIMPDHKLPVGRSIPTAVASVIATPVMERGSTKSTADRIKDIADLCESGILTHEEYTKKRQEIIDSM
jgi:hypothetical protein